MKVTDIVKGNVAQFTHCRNGLMMYNVIDHVTGRARWVFPVNIYDTEDIGNASFEYEMKAIILMRYIRKVIKDQTLVELKH